MCGLNLNSTKTSDKVGIQEILNESTSCTICPLHSGEGEEDYFSPKLRVRINDNNSSPHAKFNRFLFPFSSKCLDLNFASYVSYIYPCYVT